jgi:hypothetical protein
MSRLDEQLKAARLALWSVDQSREQIAREMQYASARVVEVTRTLEEIQYEAEAVDRAREDALVNAHGLHVRRAFKVILEHFPPLITAEELPRFVSVRRS